MTKSSCSKGGAIDRQDSHEEQRRLAEMDAVVDEDEARPDGHTSSDAGDPLTGTYNPRRAGKIDYGPIGARARTSKALERELDEGGRKKKVDGPTDIRIAPGKLFPVRFKEDDVPDEKSR